MEVMGPRGKGRRSLEVQVQSWPSAAFAHSLGQSKSQARCQRWEKASPLRGRRGKVTWPRARLQDKGTGNNAAMFANSLPHSLTASDP